jgi:hypothetical protein
MPGTDHGLFPPDEDRVYVLRRPITDRTWRGLMAATAHEAIRALMEQTMTTMEALLGATDRELAMPSSRGCAQGKDVWTLIANDIDHEKDPHRQYPTAPGQWTYRGGGQARAGRGARTSRS